MLGWLERCAWLTALLVAVSVSHSQPPSVRLCVGVAGEPLSLVAERCQVDYLELARAGGYVP